MLGRYVIQLGDDSPCPVTGELIGWISEEECLVRWPEIGYRHEYADQLMPHDR